MSDEITLHPYKPFPWVKAFCEAYDTEAAALPGLTASVRDIVCQIQIQCDPNGRLSSSMPQLAGRPSTRNFASKVVRALLAAGLLVQVCPANPRTNAAAVYQLTRPAGVPDAVIFELMSADCTNDRQRRSRVRAALEAEYGAIPSTLPPASVDTGGQESGGETPGVHGHPGWVSTDTGAPVSTDTPPPYMGVLEIHEMAEVVEKPQVVGALGEQDHSPHPEEQGPGPLLPIPRARDARNRPDPAAGMRRPALLAQHDPPPDDGEPEQVGTDEYRTVRDRIRSQRRESA